MSTPTPQTLLQMGGADLTPPAWKDAVLVIVDLQNEYKSGAVPLHNIDGAVSETAQLLQAARTHRAPVFHVVHHGQPGAAVFNPDSENAKIIDAVKPVDGEQVISKAVPSAFGHTDLHKLIQATKRKEIILAGAMTSTCISSTAREAQTLGYRTTVVASACATRSLPNPIDPSAAPISAEQVHLGALTALSDLVAVIQPNASKLVQAAS